MMIKDEFPDWQAQQRHVTHYLSLDPTPTLSTCRHGRQRLFPEDPDRCTQCTAAEQSVVTFEVWSEGYSVTGGHGTAYLIGTVAASTFPEACAKATSQARAAGKDYGEFNPDRLTVWGCRLFPTEIEARKSFG